MKHSIYKNSRAFTLLEVLATLVLIGIILPPVMHGNFGWRRLPRGSQHKVEAAGLLRPSWRK